MTNRTIKSNGVTFVDMSDKRKLEVHISSSLPTVQIFDNNSGLYTPDWSKTNLTLAARVYLDANDITDKITSFTWNGVGGTSSGAKYIVKSNVLSPTTKIQTYSCEVSYDGLTARSQMDFTRVENGVNGTVGAILGSYNTLAELKAAHPTGEKGDTYLIKGELYVWCVDNSDWQSVGNIQGPAGYTPIKGIDYVDGVDGQDGKDGVSITWKGDLPAPPSSPKLNWVYRNTIDHTVQIYNGTNWELMVLDGTDGSDGTPGSNGLSVFITYNDSVTEPSAPTVNGTTGGWHTNATTSAVWMSQKVAENSMSGTWGAPIKIKGENGTTYYTWIKYADTPTSGMSDSPDGKTYMGIAYNKTTATESTNYSDYTWALIKGVNGVDGANGKTYYTWVKYADDANGTNMSDSPDGKRYIGLAYNKSTATESNAASDYQWSLFKGADGVNGQTSYFHIKYSSVANPTAASQMTSVPNTYIGTYVDFNATDSTDPNKYTWTQFKGSQGVKGDQGVPGTNGENGLTSYLHIAYANNDTGTTGFSVSDSVNKLYMGQYTDFEPNDSTDPTKYAWTKIKGESGSNGITYYTWIKYADTPTSGISDSPTGKAYMGIAYNKTTATESNTYSDYTWSLIKGADGVNGGKGADGQTYYTWIKYATSSTGANMSDDPSGKTYMGLAYNKTTPTESTTASDYQWSLIKGSDGVNGQTYYVHIRYSANADGSSMTATPQSNTQYMGTCSTTSSTAPTTNTSYTWALIKGSTGANGANGTSYYVHIRYKESEESTTLLTTPSNYMGVYSGTSSTAPTTINSYTWYNTKGDVGAPGEAAVTFQVYSENGYILSKNTPRITLQTFAYVGDTKITADATYQWYTVTNGVDTAIAGATEPSYDVVHSDIEFRNVYKCVMVFNSIEYVGLATIEDKNDLVTTFTTKPASYSAGDIWVVGTDISTSDMPADATYGEILKAEHANTVYSKEDWIPATRYDKLLKEIKESVDEYDQFFSFDSNTGLNIKAVDANGNASQFSTTLSNDRLSFNQSNEAIAYISGSKMHIKEAEIISPLTVTGKYSGSTMQQAPTINLGGFSLVIESNGSLSIISNN